MKISQLIKCLFTCLFCFSQTPYFSQNQFKFEPNDSIVVRISNDTLKLAWGGGINYGQFSDIDFDFDNDLDLFIFDRSTNQILLFENFLDNGIRNYKRVHNAHLFFPSGLKNRATCVDFNLDGKKDLIVQGIGGIKVYKNIGNGSIGLVWQLYKPSVQTYYPGFAGTLFVSSSDIPAFVDIEGDGDLDVLTFSQGGDRVEYHQNQSQELYGTNDSLTFILKNECWGIFNEDASTNAVALNSTTPPCINGSLPNPLRFSGKNPQQGNQDFEKAHTGSTLLALDYDNSTTFDLVIGDIGATTMTLLMNGGTVPNTNSPMISADPNFPSNSTPINIDNFPAAFFVDVNFDGKRDLIGAPNAKGSSKNEKSVSYYENTNTDALPNFNFRTKAFLQEEMIEVGTGSIPVFFDENSDGLLDLIVANYFRYKPTSLKESAISLFRNVGTLTNPEFQYVTNNYLNLVSSGFGLRMFPAFGDIDNDGDNDLFLGTESGAIHFFQNTSLTGMPANFSTPPVLGIQSNLGLTINTGVFSAPQIFDLDKDGTLDLIVGNKAGEIAFYKNTGSLTNYSFTLMDATLAGIDISPTTPEGFSAPHFFRNNDTTYLFLNGENGELLFFDSIDNRLTSSFHLRNANFLNINKGSNASFTTNDLDNDGDLNLFIGQDLGGVDSYEANPNSTVDLSEITSNELELLIFPNPTNGKIHLQFAENTIDLIEISVFSIDGKLMLHTASTSKTTLNFESFSNGIYILKLSDSSGKTASKRISKI